jgi:hypothetical protein
MTDIEQILYRQKIAIQMGVDPKRLRLYLDKNGGVGWRENNFISYDFGDYAFKRTFDSASIKNL